MSYVLGIVAEYNPFHNGHLHHLIESKRITNSGYSIAVMSGNFTQRGDVSIVDKWTKAQMAIENGIDLDENNIYMDKDGLISAGTENTQLTWMDAKVSNFQEEML